jgi:hypothetical protein
MADMISPSTSPTSDSAAKLSGESAASSSVRSSAASWYSAPTGSSNS